MKKIYVFILLAVIALGSCTKSNLLVDNQDAGTSFTAIIPDDNTKTSLDGLNVYWSTGDQVDVIYDKATFETSHEVFTLFGDGPTKTGCFKGTTDLTGKNIFVVYPKSKSYFSSGNIIEIPTDVTYEGTSTIIPMYGTGTASDGITFNHLCSVIKISAYSTTPLVLESAKLTNSSSAAISGSYYFDHKGSDYGTTLVKTTTGTRNYVAIDCNGITLSSDVNNPTEFVFVIRGNVDIQPNFLLTFSDGRQWEITKSSMMPVASGKRINFPTCLVSLPADDKEMSIDGGSWEPYDVDEIRGATVSIALRSDFSKFTSSDIDAIIAEVNANKNTGLVLDMSNAQYYSSDGCIRRFYNDFLKKLITLKLPEGIKIVGNAQFVVSNGNLQDIYFPTSISTIGNGIVSPGDGIVSSTLKFHIDNALFVSDDDGVIFSNDGHTKLVAYPACRTAASYTIPSTVTEVTGSAFCYAIYIKTINVPSSVTSYNRISLYQNYNLEKIVFSGETAPTLVGGKWTAKSAPGSKVIGAKSLQIPNAASEASYNSRGWSDLVSEGYNYCY